MYALNAATGAKLWNFTTGANIFGSSPAVANGLVYIGSNDGNVYALNASTGAKLWGYTTGSSVESSPAVANGVVYVGSEDGKFYAFDLAGGMASTVAASWHLAVGFTAVHRLTVITVPRDASVTMSCAGRGCPLGHKTVRSTDRVVALAGLLPASVPARASRSRSAPRISPARS